MSDYLNDLRKKDNTELSKLLKEARVSYVDETLKLKLGKAKKEVRNKVKKQVAQILTVLKEKEILNG
jgi:ribosomal protein L29